MEYLLWIATAGLLAYETWFFVPVWRLKFRSKYGRKPVSVIVAAHNEAERLEKFLPALMDQDYPAYEVVVIDDRSTDRTPQVLEKMSERYGERLKIVTVEPQEWKTFRANKKFALTMGIKAARYDPLLFTDADCRPASRRWIARMAGALEADKDFVLGYGKYEARPGLLNKMIRFETVQTALQYTGFALRGMPYMGVGRNLMYCRSFFLDKGGFGRFFTVMSGDDDLFVNQWARGTNTAVCLHPEAHTVSVPPASWKSWFVQKRRHITTARYYRPVHRLLLGGYALARLLFWTVGLWDLVSLAWQPWTVGLMALRAGLYSARIRQASVKWQDRLPLWWIVPAEGMLVYFHLLLGLSNLIKKPQRWH